MPTSLIITPAILAAMLLAPSQEPAASTSPAAQQNLQKLPPIALVYKLSCRAEYPPEFTSSVAILNAGPGTVPVGTKVHWVFRPGVDEGNYTFTAPLTPNHKVYLSGVLHGSVAAMTACAGPVTVVK